VRNINEISAGVSLRSVARLPRPYHEDDFD
jgi:hypothetical protein